MKVVGLDVCKLSVVACILSVGPSEPRQFYYAAKFQTLEANAQGIRELLLLKPDIAVFEPTGVNYSKLWGTHLARAGIEVRLVGHTELRAYRKNTLKLPDKDDQADALALACYCFDFMDNTRRFVQVREPLVVKIREHVLCGNGFSVGWKSNVTDPRIRLVTLWENLLMLRKRRGSLSDWLGSGLLLKQSVYSLRSWSKK